MNEYNIPYIISLIVLDENEEEISQTINLFPDIPLQKIYIYPKNKHYSKKYLNEMLSSDFRQFPIDIYSHQFTKNFHNCLYGQIAVDSDGIVYPCMMMKSYPIGSLKEEHLWEIFFNKKHKPFWNLPKRDLNVCKECELNLTCFDCRALDAQATGNLKDMVYCNK
uniref:SPASM domain-containing protein n=1 Tax=Candidatus Enterococcus willemsii TaxID=1857215 RepID=UPI00403F88A5